VEISCTKEELLILEKIAFAARKSNVLAFVIGGFVRDKLLNRKTKDIDIVCLGDGIALAEAVSQLCKEKPHVNVFKTYGTAQFVINGIDVEFVGARKESYKNESRNPNVEPGTLQDDQNRRDFTINALAVSLNKDNYGKIIDPFNGLQDLEDGLLRTPLEPAQTFIDDPLRMMRAFRFAAQLNFTICDKAFESIQQNAPRVGIISKERITEELNKIILSKKPSIGFDLLFRSKLLIHIFPQLNDLAGAEYLDGKGHKDNFYHTIQVVDNIAHYTDKLWLRWAALLHDIGKPATKLFEPGHGWTFHGHEWIGSKMIPSIFKMLKLPLHEQMKYVQKIVQLHHRPVSLTKDNITDSALRRLLFDAGEDIEDLMLLCSADITSKNIEKVNRFRENFNMVSQRLKEVEESDKIRNWQPPITGELIMQTFKINPSKLVGDIKEAVREAIIEGIIPNQYEAAYDYMILKARELKLTPL
jgi:poly(A) polymerase